MDGWRSGCTVVFFFENVFCIIYIYSYIVYVILVLKKAKKKTKTKAKAMYSNNNVCIQCILMAVRCCPFSFSSKQKQMTLSFVFVLKNPCMCALLAPNIAKFCFSCFFLFGKINRVFDFCDSLPVHSFAKIEIHLRLYGMFLCMFRNFSS